MKVILEAKEFETERDRQKEAAARRWVRAANHHGEFGRWAFAVCRDPWRLPEILRKAAEGVWGRLPGDMADPELCPHRRREADRHRARRFRGEAQ